ncbi:MAG: hypothetical protein R8K21_09045 [Mariprofundales bacterium]
MNNKSSKKIGQAKAKAIGIAKRTDIKVGSSLGDFWQKIKGLYPG